MSDDVLESFVRELETSREIYAGPIAYAQVHEEPGFVGTVQVKPQVRVLPAGDPAT